MTTLTAAEPLAASDDRITADPPPRPAPISTRLQSSIGPHIVQVQVGVTHEDGPDCRAITGDYKAIVDERIDRFFARLRTGFSHSPTIKELRAHEIRRRQLVERLDPVTQTLARAESAYRESLAGADENFHELLDLKRRADREHADLEQALKDLNKVIEDKRTAAALEWHEIVRSALARSQAQALAEQKEILARVGRCILDHVAQVEGLQTLFRLTSTAALARFGSLPEAPAAAPPA